VSVVPSFNGVTRTKEGQTLFFFPYNGYDRLMTPTTELFFFWRRRLCEAFWSLVKRPFYLHLCRYPTPPDPFVSGIRTPFRPLRFRARCFRPAEATTGLYSLLTLRGRCGSPGRDDADPFAREYDEPCRYRRFLIPLLVVLEEIAFSCCVLSYNSAFFAKVSTKAHAYVLPRKLPRGIDFFSFA